MTSLISRRSVLGGAGALSVLGTLGIVDGLSGKASAATATTSCGGEEAAWGEEGPYYVLGEPMRSDVRTNTIDGSTQPGIPVTLNLTLTYRTASGGSCYVASDATVQIWSASATGVYSDASEANTERSASSDDFLRGYQITDANGACSFTTIFPGWYSGRTTHIHLYVFFTDESGTSQAFTTQLFFDPTLENNIYGSVSPYTTHTGRDTTNSTDRVYGEQVSLGGSACLVDFGTTAVASSYTADLQLLLDLPTAQSEPGTGSGGTGGPGGTPPSGAPTSTASASPTASATASPTASATASASASATNTATLAPVTKKVQAGKPTWKVAKRSDGSHTVSAGIKLGEKVTADLRIYHVGRQVQRHTVTLGAGVRSVSLSLGKGTPKSVAALLILTDSDHNTVRYTKALTLG